MSTRVLIVDDSLTVRMSLVDAFDAAHVDNCACGTIAEARLALAREPFALIVLDVLLPDGDGIAFLDELRHTPETRGIKVMLLSSEAEVRDRIRGLKTGADEYVGKPYELGYVIARACELIREARTDGASDRATVLVIDDSATFREALTEALEAAGYAVLAAASGEEGLRLAASARPTAMIVDGQLPGIDGPGVLRRIRMDAALRHTPSVLLTASNESNAEVLALDAGADAFVRKDEDLAVLLARLGAVIRSVDGPRVGEATRSLLGPRKILAVDDSETYLQELAGALRAEGYDVVLARSGEEALELLTAQPVDCILLDLMMPGISGHETCRRIKSIPIVRGIPVVMLTALEDRAAMIRGLDAGADDYIAKSSDFDVLRSRVLAQIRRKQFEDENRLIREQLAQRELEAIEARAAREVEAMQAVVAERRRSEIEMNKLQAELAHVSRWNAMGMMAATLAHEINQPLTAITNYIETIRVVLDRPDPSIPVRELLEDAARQTAQAGAIIRNLREFIERRETSRTIENLNRVVEEAMALGAVGAAHLDTRVDVKLATELPPVLVNKVQIQQVLVNLFRNALEAMRRADRRVLAVATQRDDPGFVTVSVSDTGPGIAPEVLGRLFQPFTTTKQTGMGIGLKICQSIIEAHEGEIWITPNPESGVTFRFRLPTIDPVPA